MELYIQPDLVLFPSTAVLKGDEIRQMIWSDNSSQITSEQIVACGYISVPEPVNEKTDNATLVVNKSDNDVYTTTWIPDSELKQILDSRMSGSSVRARRNWLLQQTDWSQGKDVSDVISGKWTTYRQELRDITSQPGFPERVTWPTPPQ